MPEFTLYVAPNTCARVPTIALEEIGVPFDTRLIRTAANEQNTPDYLRLNPKGKVPMLLVDGAPLTENVAILSWLNATYPDAQLFPEAADPLDAHRQIADLSFFAATVHPTVTRVAMPVKFIADTALSFDIVRPKGVEAMDVLMRMINDRLADGPWWYGNAWSIVDGYLYWVWSRITGVGYAGEAFPNLIRHAALSEERPAIQRAMAREAADIETLKSEGNFVPPK